MPSEGLRAPKIADAGAKKEIRRLINEADKTLDPKDRVRWKWGYRDGLEDALKIMEGNKDE